MRRADAAGDSLLDSLAEVAREARRLGCEEADMRAVDRELDWLTVQGTEVRGRKLLVDRGVGVRVRIDGVTGYAGSRDRGPKALREALARAIEMARAAPRDAAEARPWTAAEPQVGTYRTEMPGGDPFDVPFDERIARGLELTAVLGGDPRVVAARANEVLLRVRTRLATLHGTRVDQEVTLHGGGIEAVAQDAGQLQQRPPPRPRRARGRLRLGRRAPLPRRARYLGEPIPLRQRLARSAASRRG